MKKLSLLLAAGVLILGACSDPSSTEESKKEAPSSNENESKKEKTENEEPEKDEQPFKALEPSEDAVSLDKSLSEQEKQKIPEMQAALGGNPERTVPVGETLTEGVKDPSMDH